MIRDTYSFQKVIPLCIRWKNVANVNLHFSVYWNCFLITDKQVSYYNFINNIFSVFFVNTTLFPADQVAKMTCFGTCVPSSGPVFRFWYIIRYIASERAKKQWLSFFTLAFVIYTNTCHILDYNSRGTSSKIVFSSGLPNAQPVFNLVYIIYQHSVIGYFLCLYCQ
jgi:hypothetical protein